ncbi:MAG: LytR C-terminal domain-containing protein [Candidatus Saccharibacteria bacterium]|nr:LytR C-terminal domain-containing protein [Candidatus Saccharibacteria bacterium]
MLNTQKLLYILPDVAYVAELLPGKKPHSFTVQSFRQINGDYVTDTGLVADKIQKLIAKLEEGEYHVVLPDSLFTNTIVTVKETEAKKIETYVHEHLLPDLKISDETHFIALSTLTSLKGESRVQLSALEKSVTEPLTAALEKASCSLTEISPLSWTMKAVVSLEPSITVLQLGKNLYSSLHYIGVDQPFQTEVSDVDAIEETIKTLKGSEPNIQTVYLVTNSVAEEKLKELLSDTLPIQQLNPLKEDDAKLPSYVKYCLESGQKTLSISDYPVPKFSLGDQAKGKKPTKAASTDTTESTPALEAPEEPEALPQPSTPQVSATVTSAKETISMSDTAPTTDAKETDAAEETKTAETPKEAVEVAEATPEETKAAEEKPAETSAEPEPISVTPAATESASSVGSDTSNQAKGDVDLSQFAVQAADATAQPSAAEPAAETPSKPIKNQSGVGSMIKMVVITLVVFIATVAIGVGIGFGLLTLSKSKAPASPTPTEETTTVEATATPEPTPEASASAKMEPKDMSVLVVNATTKAGYASTIKTKLEDAGYGTVDAGNANGEYADADNNLVLMSEMDAGTIDQLEKATSLGLAYSEGYSTEDAKGTYDAVIVLTK